jgi:hypothetical protein
MKTPKEIEQLADKAVLTKLGYTNVRVEYK